MIVSQTEFPRLPWGLRRPHRCLANHYRTLIDRGRLALSVLSFCSNSQMNCLLPPTQSSLPSPRGVLRRPHPQSSSHPRGEGIRCNRQECFQLLHWVQIARLRPRPSQAKLNAEASCAARAHTSARSFTGSVWVRASFRNFNRRDSGSRRLRLARIAWRDLHTIEVQSTWGSSTQRVCLAVSSTTTSTLQRVMHSRLGDLRRRTPCPPPRSSSHHSLNTSIEDEKRAGLCRVRSADVCAPRRCKWPKVHTTPCPMKYEAEGQRNAVAKKKEIAKLLFVTCQKLLHRQNCAEAEEVGSNSDDNKNAMQSLFWLEGPKPTKTASAAHSSTNCRGRFSSFAAFGNSYDRGGVSQRDWRHPTEASESEATPREKQRPRSHSCHERLILKPLLGHVAHGSKF